MTSSSFRDDKKYQVYYASAPHESGSKFYELFLLIHRDRNDLGICIRRYGKIDLMSDRSAGHIEPLTQTIGNRARALAEFDALMKRKKKDGYRFGGHEMTAREIDAAEAESQLRSYGKSIPFEGVLNGWITPKPSIAPATTREPIVAEIPNNYGGW